MTKDSSDDVTISSVPKDYATPFQSYLKDIRDYGILTRSEEKELARKAKNGCEKSKESLVHHNLKLVISVARRYEALARIAAPSLSLEDLISEGNIGLWKALERFDPERGFKISTYAVWWIEEEIRNAIQSKGRTIRIPSHIIEKLNRLRKISDSFFLENQESPLPGAIAPNTSDEYKTELKKTLLDAGFDSSFLDNLDNLKNLLNLASLDAPSTNSSEESNASLSDFIADEQAIDPFELAHQNSEKEDLLELISTLKPKERQVIQLRFSVYEGEEGPKRGLTLEETGHRMGITRERVRQIQVRALKKLRARISAKNNPLMAYPPKEEAETETPQRKKSRIPTDPTNPSQTMFIPRGSYRKKSKRGRKPLQIYNKIINQEISSRLPLELLGITLSINEEVFPSNEVSYSILKALKERLLNNRMPPKRKQTPYPWFGLNPGCGMGTLAIGASLLTKTKIIATDSSPDAIKLCNRNKRCDHLARKNIETRKGKNLSPLPPKEFPYDFILCFPPEEEPLTNNPHPEFFETEDIKEPTGLRDNLLQHLPTLLTVEGFLLIAIPEKIRSAILNEWKENYHIEEAPCTHPDFAILCFQH